MRGGLCIHVSTSVCGGGIFSSPSHTPTRKLRGTHTLRERAENPRRRTLQSEKIWISECKVVKEGREWVSRFRFEVNDRIHKPQKRLVPYRVHSDHESEDDCHHLG